MARLQVFFMVCLLTGLSKGQKAVEENEINVGELNNKAVDDSNVIGEVLTEDGEGDQGNALQHSINSSFLVEVLQKKLLATVQALEETNKRLEANEEKLTALGMTVAKLRSVDRGTNKIAFSVTHPIEGTINSANAPHNLVYGRVLSNIGEHYNQYTGFFRAPMRGVYFFTFTSHCWGGDVQCVGSLYHNNRRTVSWYFHMPHANAIANTAILLLNTGDHVNVRLWEYSRISDNGNHYSTFNGFLLFAM